MFNDKLTRREAMLSGTAALAGGAALLGQRALAQRARTEQPPQTEQPEEGFDFEPTNPARDNTPSPASPLPPGMPGRDYTPVIAPNAPKLPWKVVNGVKVYHLVAEEVEHDFAEGLTARCWGYNGSVHGPVIEGVQGDRVRIFVTNHLETPTTVHWHGVLLPSGMDGVGGLSQRAIYPGQTYKYEFTLNQYGTLMYHSHHDEMTQIGMGMTGLFIIHPRGVPVEERPDRDFAILLHEWAIDVGARRPDPFEMTDFNVLTMNAKVFPATEPLVVRRGQRVRIRIGNLSPMSHHPIHLHGYYFKITGTDGGAIPDVGQWPETTVLVPVGATRDIEFVATNAGDWAMHCHMTHHIMNQMGHDFPNMIGVDARGLDRKIRQLIPGYMTMGTEGMGDPQHMQHMPMPENSIPMLGAQGPYDYITMGGMFTILKVREQISADMLARNADPGWYETPPGTLATRATPAELRRNGIEVRSIEPTLPPIGHQRDAHGVQGRHKSHGE